MPTMSAGTDQSRVMDALRRIVRALSTSARTPPAATKVSGAQLFVLREIARAPGLTVGELAARTLARQSAVSEVLSRLSENGLVTRAASPTDGRQTLLDLSAKGRRTVETAEPTAQERLTEALSALPATQRASLADALEQWLAEAGFADLPATMFFEGARRTRSAR